MKNLTNLQETITMLQGWLLNPTYNMDAMPCLKLSNGKKIVIEQVSGGYYLNRDYGHILCSMGICRNLTELAKTLIDENRGDD